MVEMFVAFPKIFCACWSPYEIAHVSQCFNNLFDSCKAGTWFTVSLASRFSRVNTLPVKKYSAKLEPDSGPIKLERSRTERQRHSNILASEAAQIFDNKIPIQNPNSCQQFPGTEPKFKPKS